ncbi:MAG TPA: hypothetical protein VLV31_07025 [Candidatus Acidoferrales bacterium]|nr:hypothetical protein [Candidatus Acidoferrales bacterium]
MTGLPKSKKLREYRSGTFEKRVAYGQRDRKLWLVARGIMNGFRVDCKSEKAAKDLAFGLRVRAPRIAERDDARFGIRVRVAGRRVLVVGFPKREYA